MTNKERVMAAIRHEETDYIPHSVTFTTKMLAKMVEYTGDPDYLNTIDNHIEKISLKKPLKPIPGKFERYTDEFNIEWDLSGVDKDIGFVAEHPLKNAGEIYAYDPPGVDEAFIRNACENLVNNKKDNLAIASVGFTIFERGWSLCGMEDLLCYMLIEPEAVDALFDKLLAYSMRKTQIVLEYDIDGIIFGDDWGRQKGLIMGAPLWRRLIKPRVKTMYAAVKAKNKIVMQHSCGDNSDILNDLIEIGLDVYQTFQPEIYDINVYKRKYAGRLAFWGGIGTQTVLPFGTPDEAYNITKKTMGILGKGGGYIAAPTHDIPGDVPPKNVEAMIRAFREQ